MHSTKLEKTITKNGWLKEVSKYVSESLSVIAVELKLCNLANVLTLQIASSCMGCKICISGSTLKHRVGNFICFM